MRKQVLFHKKDFLNLDGHLSDASVFSRITREEYESEKMDGEIVKKSYIETELKIRDCDKAVYLDINIDTPAERLNTLHKIDVLINHLQQLKQAINEQE